MVCFGVITIIFLKLDLNMRTKLMKVIILAAGQGIRLGGDYNKTPKCLLKVGNKTIIERQIESLNRIGIKDITIVIGAKGCCWNQETFEQINALSQNIIINFNNDSTLNAYSAFLALDKNNPTDFLLIDGDLVYSEILLKKFFSYERQNLIVVKKAESKKEIGCRVVADTNGKLIKIGKNIIDIIYPWDIHSGIIKIVKSSYSDFYQELNDKIFLSEELDAPIGSFIKNNKIHVLKTSSTEWVNINTQSELNKAKKIF